MNDTKGIAIMAMKSIIERGTISLTDYDEVARHAYEYAEAMNKEELRRGLSDEQ